MTFIYLLALLSPLFVILLGFKQRFTLLWWYAIAGLIIDNLGHFLKSAKIEHHWAGNIFLLAECILVSFYYRKIIFRNQIIFWIVVLSTTLFFITHTIYYSMRDMNMQAASLLYLIYMGFGIAGFYKLLHQPEIIYLGKSSFFIINAAFFIYASANFLLYLFGTYLRKNDFEFLVSIWGSFFMTINILHYFVIGIGLSKTKTK